MNREQAENVTRVINEMERFNFGGRNLPPTAVADIIERAAGQDDGPKEIRELLCQKCNRDYPVWFAPNELWNRVAEGKFHFLCMDCFGLFAQEQGVKPTAWMLAEEDINLSMALEKIRRLEHPELGPSPMEDSLRAAGETAWVSVEERLPELGQMVLTWRNGRIQSDCLAQNKTGSTVPIWTRECVQVTGNVTHWQPLPPPPTAEEKK